MKHYKLPFKINLDRKYNDLNIDKYYDERNENENERKTWNIALDNDLHMELGKYKTFDISLDEIIDLALRYAFNKYEFRRLSAQLIEEKSLKKHNL
ncbi:hypothetical protein [uncultured Weeksella sp.]|uniref:hypothetical protein n=1 Tax=uncultured Weeksella sp. TaxID=1161389 RepID=UPI00259AF660|nr:hypothetical protein [uncultured Weeksella sp.]